jgi:hypothetical protein
VTPRNTGWTSHARGVSALIAVLVRYPEVSSLNFDPETGVLTVSFCVKGAEDPERWQTIQDHIGEVLEAYREIVDAPTPRAEAWQTDTMESMTVVNFVRDVDTLTVEEVGLVIELLRDAAGPDLMADPNELAEDEWLLQEETIQATLESLKESPGGSLLALREEGRIFVFNT